MTPTERVLRVSPSPRASTVVVLAAGKGQRLNGYPIDTKPKPVIKVSGRSLVEHCFRTFTQAHITRFVFVVGFEREAIRSHIESVAEQYACEVVVVDADRWRLGNGVSALAAADAVPDDHFLLAMCDHMLQPGMIAALQGSSPESGGVVLGVDRNPVFDIDDLTKVKLDGKRLIGIDKDLDAWDAGDTGLFHCTQGLFDGLEEAQQGGRFSLSDGVRVLASKGRVLAHDLTGYEWIDIDTPEALAEAERRIANKAVVQNGDAATSDEPNPRESEWRSMQ